MDAIYAHWNPDGTFLSQKFSNKLNETGTFKLIPSKFALIAVQRQTAASRSVRPPMRPQHSVFFGVPIIMPTKLFNKVPHTLNLRVSLGQVALVGDGGDLGTGEGGDLGCGGGGGQAAFVGVGGDFGWGLGRGDGGDLEWGDGGDLGWDGGGLWTFEGGGGQGT
ncbi:hypothetical protein QQ045_019706 [Rhodiola kirilowii]